MPFRVDQNCDELGSSKVKNVKGFSLITTGL